MEPVNFIITMTPCEQQTLRRWYYLSAFMIIGALMVMMGITAYQMYTLNQGSDQQTVDTQAHQIERLRHQEQDLQDKYQKVAQFHAKNPLSYLVALEENLPEGASINTLLFSEYDLELTFTCPQIQNIGVYRSKLGHIGYFLGITVLSIEPSKEGFLGHIRGSTVAQT